MRPIISAFLFVFVSFVCAAQNDRALNGIVYGENGGPLTGATVYAVGTDLSAKTDTAGRFALAVPHFVEELRAECPGYHALVRRIDDTFMVFKMALDEKYASRAYEYAAIEAKLAQDKEKRVIEAAKAKVRAEKNAEKRKVDSLYNLKYKNIGLVHSVEISYGYQLAHGEVIYKNLGFREYGSLHPVELNYTMSYRFHNFFSLGIGTGLQYQLVNLCRYPDVFDPSYTGYEDFTPVNVPLFLNLKSYLTRGSWQPLVSVSAGVYCPNLEGLADVGIGLNYRLSRTSNVYLLLSVRTTPYGDFRKYTSSVIGGDRNFSAYYPGVAWTPSFKVGCTF